MDVALLGSVAAWSALAVALVAVAVLARPWPRVAWPPAPTAARPVAGRILGGVAALVSVALLCLAWALVSGDYRLVYVAEASARSSSWAYRLAGLWGGMAGSLLFWTCVLSLVAVVATRSVRHQRPDLVAPTSAVLAALMGAFLAIGLVWANPFDRLAVPAIDGAGLAPILGHPAMLYHPPLLYLGLVSCAVPFAVAVPAWSVAPAIRRGWPWSGAGPVPPGWSSPWACWPAPTGPTPSWAGVGSGPGTRWRTPPFSPWLGATALLHAAMVDEHRARVRPSTIALALATNVLALVGTLLTRSGAVSSVHAFRRGGGGGASPARLVVAGVGSAALWWRRRPPLAHREPSAGWLHRRRVLDLNAMVVLGVAVVVAFGTLFPLVAEVAGGRPFVVNGRFFALLCAPLALAALGLVGLAPVLRWRGGVTRGGRRTLPLAGAASMVAGGVAGVAGMRQPFALAAVPLAAFSATLLVAELARRIRAPGRPWPAAERPAPPWLTWAWSSS